MTRRLLSVIIVTALLAAGIGAALRFGLIPVPGRTPGDAVVDGRTNAAPAGEVVPSRPPVAAVVVTVVAARPRPVERRVRTVGTLHGFEEIEVGTLVDGRVRRILHDVGDVVSPGEPLLEIDDTDFRLAVEETSRSLGLELARLGLTAAPDGPFDVTSLPSVERARVVEKNAADVLERSRGLVASKTITKDEFEKAEVAFETARLDVKQRILEAEQALAAVRHRLAVLDTVRKRLADTRVVAPETNLRTMAADGASASAPITYTVADRLVAEGEIVRAAPPTRLFRLVVDDVLKLKAAVPERYAAQVQPGQSVDLGVESLPGKTVAGRVVRVNPTIDTANRTFEVEVQVPNVERLLKPGAFATASILVGADANAITVPEEAIVRFAGVTKLFTVADGRAMAVPVELGVRLDAGAEGGASRRWVEVTGAVEAGMPVVVTGHSQLADGTAVRIREPAPMPAAVPEADAP